jgi:hypothetical protein
LGILLDSVRLLIPFDPSLGSDFIFSYGKILAHEHKVMHVQVVHSVFELIKSAIGRVFMFVHGIELGIEAAIKLEQLLKASVFRMVVGFGFFVFEGDFLFF